MIEYDKQRRLYLVPLRLSAEAIVLRHYPIGKGFIVSLKGMDDRYHDLKEDAGRPPYLFVKCWSCTYERLTGIARVKYDVRDIGWKVDHEHILYVPAEANKQLLIWETKKRLGVLSVAQVAGAAKRFAGKLGRQLKSEAATCIQAQFRGHAAHHADDGPDDRATRARASTRTSAGQMAARTGRRPVHRAARASRFAWVWPRLKGASRTAPPARRCAWRDGSAI